MRIIKLRHTEIASRSNWDCVVFIMKPYYIPRILQIAIFINCFSSSCQKLASKHCGKGLEIYLIHQTWKKWPLERGGKKSARWKGKETQTFNHSILRFINQYVGKTAKKIGPKEKQRKPADVASRKPADVFRSCRVSQRCEKIPDNESRVARNTAVNGYLHESPTAYGHILGLKISERYG